MQRDYVGHRSAPTDRCEGDVLVLNDSLTLLRHDVTREDFYSEDIYWSRRSSRDSKESRECDVKK